ncbi:acetyl-CoA hydrolase/transferase C-terminal domain-containing protein [Curtobacterium sp. 1544]|jgi:itaconate CoA-transferase|uniref:acetyl-CoA hydrolase/transferase family protein n=1 Tax=Curtobacterium sp. 1544 TaxID=3156417 RepID=UPI003395E933
MDLKAEYAERLTNGPTAVALIESHSTVALGQAAGQPPQLMRCLADRAAAGGLSDVRLYYFHSEQPMADTLLRYELMDDLHPYSFFLQAPERKLIDQGAADGHRKVVNFVPSSFGQSVRTFRDAIPVDTFLVQVSPMDTHGYFSFGTNNDYTSAVARMAKRLIVEVNPNMPRVYGADPLHLREVDAIIEHTSDLPSLAPRPVRPNEQSIGSAVAALVPDGATLQIGVGGLPNAVCAALRDRNDLGIHTEALGPGLADLIDRGNATGNRKNIDKDRAVFTFAMGDNDFYGWMHENQAIMSAPVDYVNDPAVIARNDRVVSINSTIEMDLTGAANSEHLNGHQFSASGGQLDFIRGAAASKGGLSIIAFPSTVRSGTISKIVPRLSGPVTTPRNDVHYVVTEHGTANLRGLSSSDRARALIALAAPEHRSELEEAAREQHLV